MSAIKLLELQWRKHLQVSDHRLEGSSGWRVADMGRASDFGHTENVNIVNVGPASTRHPFLPAFEVHDFVLLGQTRFAV